MCLPELEQSPLRRWCVIQRQLLSAPHWLGSLHAKPPINCIGVKGQSGKWPCDPLGPQSGAVFWYCEDGPGWKPPPELRERARRYAEEEAHAQQEQEEAVATVLKSARVTSGNTVGRPSAPANVFETLWYPAPLKVCPSPRLAARIDLEFLSHCTTAAVAVANRPAWNWLLGLQFYRANRLVWLVPALLTWT